VLALFRQLATSRVGVLSLRAPPLRILKSRITLFSGPTTRPSPVALHHSGTLVVHIHAPTSIPSKIQRLGPLSDLRRRSFRRFGVFGHREFVHPTSRTSICRNPEITVYSSAESDGQLPSYDLRCRSFRDFGFRVFGGVHLPHFPSPDFAKSERFRLTRARLRQI
jgi:hypothetical protein